MRKIKFLIASLLLVALYPNTVLAVEDSLNYEVVKFQKMLLKLYQTVN